METPIHLRVDNTATLAWINRQNALNETVHLLLREFWEFYAKKQIWVHASYISSSRNKVAYKESKKLRHNLEWSLKEKFFEKIVGNFGSVTTDLFASRVNCKVNRYYPYNLEPETIRIDAFSYRWSNETFYVFPPFALGKIVGCLREVRYQSNLTRSVNELELTLNLK